MKKKKNLCIFNEAKRKVTTYRRNYITEFCGPENLSKNIFSESILEKFIMQIIIIIIIIIFVLLRWTGAWPSWRTANQATFILSIIRLNSVPL